MSVLLSWHDRTAARGSWNGTNREGKGADEGEPKLVAIIVVEQDCHCRWWAVASPSPY